MLDIDENLSWLSKLDKDELYKHLTNDAKLIYDKIKKRSAGIRSIAVWENENSCATYTEGPKSR